MESYVFGVSTVKNPSPQPLTSRQDHSTGYKIRTCPSGHRGSTAALERSSFHSYNDRSIHLLAGGRSYWRHYSKYDSENFFTHWISRFGSPRLITTDQGTQFEAQLFNALTSLVGTERYRTTAYHPESNGIIERWHRSLKTALTCHSSENWIDVLPVALLGLRTCLKEDLGSSVAVIVYGTTLRVPGEFFTSEEMPSNPRIFVEDFRVAMQKLRPSATSHHIKPRFFYHKRLHDCSHVFLRDDSTKRPLEQPYSGPHKVNTRISDKVFTIDVNGRAVNVTVDRLKPAYLLDNPEASQESASTSSNTSDLRVYARPNTQNKEPKTIRFASCN